MAFLEVGKYYKSTYLITSILFFHPASSADFLDRIFGDTPPAAAVSRTSSLGRGSTPPSIAEKPVRTTTQSSQGKRNSTEARGDTKAQNPPQVAVFLESLPKTLEKMDEIESQMVALIPQHPRNLMKILKVNTPPDWRVLSALQVSEPLDSSIVDRIKQIPSTDDVLKKKEAVKKEKEAKKKAKKSPAEKGVDPKQKLQKSSSLPDLAGAFIKEDVEALSLSQKIGVEEGFRVKLHMPTMLRMWFLQECNPGPQQLAHYSHFYSQFSQWFDNLPYSISESDTMKSLYPLLRQGSNTSQILNLINELVVESMLLKAQLLYEQLVPIYLDSVTSKTLLESVKEEALREDRSLLKILANNDLFNFIESFFATRIAETLIPLTRDFLLKQPIESKDGAAESKDGAGEPKETIAIKVITEEQLSVITALQDAFKDSLTVELDPIPAKIAGAAPAEGEHDKSAEKEKLITLKSTLQKAIADTIKTALQKELNQATGRKMQDGQPSSSSTSLAPILKKVADTSKQASENDEVITIDVAPIMQIIVDFVNPPTAPSYLSRQYWKGQTSITPIPVEVRIPEEKQDEWKISFSKDLIKAERSDPPRPINPSVIRISPKPPVQTPPKTFEESKKEYEQALRKGMPSYSPAFLKEIRNLRVPKFSISVSKSFNELKRNPTLLYCLPRAYAYGPGMSGAQLVENMARFFTAYAETVTSYQDSLENSGTRNLSVYLDEKRPSVQFCKNNKTILFDAFSLLNDRKIRRNWTSFYDIDLSQPIDPAKGRSDKFGNELHEFIIFLARVDGMSDEFFNPKQITVSRLIPTAKRILLFKVKCDALMNNQPVPPEKEHVAIMESLFEKKCAAAGDGVKKALDRMLIREKHKGLHSDDQYFKDRTLLNTFLTNLFKETLTACFSGLGMTEHHLFELQSKITASPEEFLQDEKGTDSTRKSSWLASWLTSWFRKTGQQNIASLRESLTIHVPALIEGNPLVPEAQASIRAVQLEELAQNLDDDLPPIRRWHGNDDD